MIKFPRLESVAKQMLHYAPHWRDAPTYTAPWRNKEKLDQLYLALTTYNPGRDWAIFGPGGVVKKVVDSDRMNTLNDSMRQFVESTARHFTKLEFETYEVGEAIQSMRGLGLGAPSTIYVVDRSVRVLQALRKKQILEPQIYSVVQPLTCDLEREIPCVNEIPILCDVGIAYVVVSKTRNQERAVSSIAHSVRKGGILSIEDSSLDLGLERYGYTQIREWTYLRERAIGPRFGDALGKLPKRITFKPKIKI